MKFAIALLIAMPLIANAGSCYKATTSVYGDIPAVMCLDSIQTTATENVLFVNSPDRSFPAILDITKTSRHNEDRLNFTAEVVLADVWNSGCGDGFKATLKVESEMTYGLIYADYLNVSIETESTNDTCHSQPQTEVIKYELVK